MSMLSVSIEKPQPAKFPSPTLMIFSTRKLADNPRRSISILLTEAVSRAPGLVYVSNCGGIRTAKRFK